MAHTSVRFPPPQFLSNFPKLLCVKNLLWFPQWLNLDSRVLRGDSNRQRLYWKTVVTKPNFW